MKDLQSFQDMSHSEFINFFIKNLQRSITGWDYFVDWNKVKNNVGLINTELNILNSLIGSKNIEIDFINLCKKYPEIKPVLPVLIAVRRGKLNDQPILLDGNTLSVAEVDYLFTKKGDDFVSLKKFLLQSGLKELFQDRTVKNLVDYVTGVEVGMDTNGRKNRTGKIMETIVENTLKGICFKKGMEYGIQMNAKSIKNRWGITVPTDKSKRKFDFVVFNRNKITLMEVNFYRGGGTKLKATVGEYITLAKMMRSSDIKFVWVTDGLGWKSSHIPLEEAFAKNEYIFNLYMINNGILEEIL